MVDKSYEELPLTVRALLETMSDQRAVTLVNALDFYADLPEASREFLLRAKPQTLNWLRDRRPEEINELAAVVSAWQSAKTIKRFLFWLVIVFGGSLITAATLGGQLLAWLDTFRGVHK